VLQIIIVFHMTIRYRISRVIIKFNILDRSDFDRT